MYVTTNSVDGGQRRDERREHRARIAAALEQLVEDHDLRRPREERRAQRMSDSVATCENTRVVDLGDLQADALASGRSPNSRR